uniref:Oxidoreductase N-terminal domain-containing protein n=1 Tax=Gossypium raimondii TaxID=29730 RepID=A0A0D2RD38_GOSRA|nr:hypothetical protein B456_005G007100 [Gossypium raimondii]
MATGGMDEASNMKVVLKHYVSGSPQETDMHLTAGTIKLKVPKDSNSIILKNLYLSCDPYMIFKMMKLERQLTDPYVLGSVKVVRD